jgi:hypothetical protein
MAPYGNTYNVTSAAEFMALVRSIQDPYRKVEVLKSRLATLRRIGAPPMVISELEAQLRAARRQVAELEEGKKYTQEWRGLGQTSLVLTQGLLVALTVAAIVATITLVQRR